MATTKDYRDYVLEQLSCVEGISCKPMMGEFLLYKNGVLFGGLYDNRFLVKKTKSIETFGFKTAIPYDGAKEMYELDIEGIEDAIKIIELVCKDLKK